MHWHRLKKRRKPFYMKSIVFEWVRMQVVRTAAKLQIRPKRPMTLLLVLTQH